MTASTGERAVVDFDHHSPTRGMANADLQQELRQRCPVAFSEHHGGFWVLSGYEELAAAARAEAKFSSRHDDEFLGINIPEAPYRNALIEMDPPEWNAFRRLLNPRFAPPAMEQYKPKITEFTDFCIDRRIESGTIDFVLDLANPVPAVATLALLGLDLDEWERYAEPCHQVVYSLPGSDEFAQAVAGQQWMFENVAAQIADRRVNPRDDFLSYAVQADIDGRRFSDEELVSLCGTIINGGVDTTTALVANAIEYLDRNHEDRQLLVDHPDRIPIACEEFLRYFTPVQSFARTAADDVELGGHTLQRGDRVLMCFGSANHDADEFPDADEFVIDRSPNRHVSFGLGKHRCIGSHLARAEFAIILERVLARMPDYEIDRDGTEKYPTIGIVNGYIKMPGRFTPGTLLA